MVELGIVDIREIIRLINTQYNYDFSNQALTSLKFRLERVMEVNNFRHAESLFRKLNDQPEYFDTFLHEMAVPSTEMFRDPSLWRWLREDFLSKLSDNELLNFKIWLPNCVSGGELFSICIVLHELQLLEKVKITATCFSDKSIEYIKSGKYPVKKFEISQENYKRIQAAGEYTNYCQVTENIAQRDTSLLKNVQFVKDDVNYTLAPMNAKLILYRNSLIYYNPNFISKVLDRINKALSASGYLIVGVNEQVNTSNSNGEQFEVYNENESVYTKKL
jgi:chemotaxis protein methyltransferase CheR